MISRNHKFPQFFTNPHNSLQNVCKNWKGGQWELVCLHILITGNPSQNLIKLIICKYTKFISNRRDSGWVCTGLKFEGCKSTLVSEGLGINLQIQVTIRPRLSFFCNKSTKDYCIQRFDIYHTLMYEQMNKHMYVYLFVDLFFIGTYFLSVF